MVLQAQNHQHVPFELLVDKLQPHRQLAYQPLAQIMINYFESAQTKQTPLDDLHVSSYQSQSEQTLAKLDLTLYITKYQQQFQCNWVYASALFKKASIKGMSVAFEQLIKAVINTPTLKLKDIRYLTESQSQSYFQSNRHSPSQVGEHAVPELIRNVAARTPEALALIHNSQQLTYAELDLKSDEVATYLLMQKLPADSIVGVYCERGFEYVIAILGILKAGACYLPLATDLPAGRLEEMIEDAAPKLILTHIDNDDGVNITNVSQVRIEDARVSVNNADFPVLKPQQLAHIIYTSGTTGKPKGVLGNHLALANRVNWMLDTMPFTSDETASLITSISFVRAVFELFPALVAGRTLVIIDKETVLDGNGLIDTLAQHKVTRIVTAPSLANTLLSLTNADKLETLKYWFISGEQLKYSLAELVKSRLPDTRLYNLYGTTEVSSDVTYHEFQINSSIKPPIHVPVGQPISHTQLFILDNNHHPVIDGMPGELCVAGHNLSLGYYSSPDLTAAKFIHLTCADGQSIRVYRTGDLVRKQPGTEQDAIEYLGRIDSQVKIRGFRIELAEIECKIMQLNAIQEACVITQPAQVAQDQQEQQLIAYYILQPNCTESEQDILRQLKQNLATTLPDYMLPAAYQRITSMPYRANGKINKQAFARVDVKNGLEYQAPVNETQARLCQLWQSVLKVEKVGIEDNFFQLGGHSLLAIKLSNQIRAELGMDISVKNCFTHPTVHQMAQLSSQNDSMESYQLPIVDRTQALSLSAAQQRLWFIDQFEEGSGHYNITGAFQFNGEVNLPAIKQSLQAIIERHEVLRSRFLPTADGANIRFHQDVEFPLIEIDLSDLTSQQQTEQCQSLISVDARHIFDLENELLIRAHLIKLGTDQHLILFNMHHIVSDGWSLGLFVHEFTVNYRTYALNEPTVLKPLSAQYQDYTHWQNNKLVSGQLDPQKQYWLEQLADLPPLHNLPINSVRPQVQQFHGRRYINQLSKSISQELIHVAKHHDSSLFMLLQTAFALLLSRFSGESDIVMGTPIAGRNHHQAQPLIGLFINTLVLRTQLNDDTSFLELLNQNRKMILSGFEHQDITFEQLVDILNPKRNLSHSPLFQILFVLEHSDPINVELPGINVEAVQSDNNDVAIKYDLELYVVQHDQQLQLNWNYNPALFSSDRIEQMSDCFDTLLCDIANTPDKLCSELDIVSVAEHQKMAKVWQQASEVYPDTQCIHHLFEQQARKRPDETALVFQDRSITYGELEGKANQLAHYLRHKGVVTEDFVALYMERSIDMLVAMLAILKAGAAYLPLDPGYPSERIRYMLEDSECKLILTHSEIESYSDFPKVVQHICLDRDTQITPFPDTPICLKDDEVSSSHLAYLIYTSGSTGKPKAVMIEHKNALNLFGGIDDKLNYADDPQTWLAITSISFDISVLELLYVLCRGNKIVLLPDRPVVQSDPETAADLSLLYFAAEESETIGDKYQLLLEGAKIADQNGLDGVWIPERHFASFGDQFPNPSVAAAAVAATTSNVKIRSGSVVFPLHDPIRIAEEWSMVDNLSNRRVELSAASGWHPNDFVLAPDNYHNRHQVMKDNIKTVSDLWQGKSVTRSNGVGTEIEVKLHPSPISPSLPIWLTAAGNPETFRHAGSTGANVLTHLLSQTVEEVAEKIAIYRQARSDAGFAPEQGKVALMVHTFIGEDQVSTCQIVEQPFKNYLRHSINLIKPLAEEAGLDIETDLDAIIDMAFERYFHQSSLFGDLDSCEQKLTQFQAMGVDEIACLIDFGVEHKVCLDNLLNIARLKQRSHKKAMRQQFLNQRFEHQISIKELIEQHKVTHLQCTPSFVRELLADKHEKQGLCQLKQLLIGGEALSNELASDLNKHFSGDLFNMYGPTETTVWSTVAQISTTPVSIGSPISNTYCFVVDQHKQLVPHGVSGELLIGGAGVARGYFKRPQLSKEKFIHSSVSASSPLNQQARLYRTGDRVKMDASGQLSYLARMDDQVKFRGYRIELGEIEAQAKHFGNIHSCVAVIQGQSPHQRICLFVTSEHYKHSQEFSKPMRYFLSQSLPGFMLPDKIILLDKLPLTPNGKIDKKQLYQFDSDVTLTIQYAPPESELEQNLCEYWQTLLSLNKVGIDDNFFNIGGNSLTVVRFVNTLRDELALKISIKDVFSLPTIRELADFIQQAAETNKSLDKLY